MDDIDISKAAFYICRQVGKKKNENKQTNKHTHTQKKETKKKNQAKTKGKCNQVGAMIFHPYRENIVETK